MRVVTVTGADGFLGTHLIRRILTLTDWRVVAVSHHGMNLVNPRVWRYTADLTTNTDLPKTDVIFSVAAHVDVAASLRDPRGTVETNTGIANTIVHHARRTGALVVHVSTAEVFGPGGPHGLECPARPTNPYAASKAAQDAIFHTAKNAYSVPVVTARTANVFGEAQPAAKFVPTVVRKILAREPVRLFGHAKRRWIHADDVADTLLRIAVTPVDANVTGSELLPNEEIVHRIADRLGVDARIEIDTDVRPGHEDVYDLTPAGPVTDDLDAGLDRAVAWWSRREAA